MCHHNYFNIYPVLPFNIIGPVETQNKFGYEWSDTESNIHSPPEDFGLGSITCHPRAIVPASLNKTALDSDTDTSVEGKNLEKNENAKNDSAPVSDRGENGVGNNDSNNKVNKVDYHIVDASGDHVDKNKEIRKKRKKKKDRNKNMKEKDAENKSKNKLKEQSNGGGDAVEQKDKGDKNETVQKKTQRKQKDNMRDDQKGDTNSRTEQTKDKHKKRKKRSKSKQDKNEDVIKGDEKIELETTQLVSKLDIGENENINKQKKAKKKKKKEKHENDSQKTDNLEKEKHKNDSQRANDLEETKYYEEKGLSQNVKDSSPGGNVVRNDSQNRTLNSTTNSNLQGSAVSQRVENSVHKCHFIKGEETEQGVPYLCQCQLKYLRIRRETEEQGHYYRLVRFRHYLWSALLHVKFSTIFHSHSTQCNQFKSVKKINP